MVVIVLLMEYNYHQCSFILENSYMYIARLFHS